MTSVVSTKTIAIGFVAGLASALLVLSPVSGSLLAVPLTIMVGLPLVIASLGWGTAAGILAVVVGIGALSSVSVLSALNYAIVFAPSAVIGSHLIGLARPAVEPHPIVPGMPALPGRAIEWFPLGRILAIVALIAVAGMILTGVVRGVDPTSLPPEQIEKLARAYADAVEAAGDPGVRPTRSEIEPALHELLAAMMAVLPFMLGIVSVLFAVVNLYLGAWVTSLSGRLARPWEDVAAFELPRWMFGLYAAAIVGATADGPLGAVFMTIVGALTLVHLLVGLAVVHTLTRGVTIRVGLLVAIYVFIGLFAVPLVLLGIAELFIQLRLRARRKALTPRNPG